ncbi:hypothetical protein K7711_16240 [Nocardia sp. CA2R105]|uniref:hypothetical protein n=1 Tax=Nocardia coffeae TaxID=2873381 RepID=UPI001CA7A973|nr:hypothetical protein [Nocardia coffeae]MBY8858036.1 hypothetical protein [Nocardia coffeae]
MHEKVNTDDADLGRFVVRRIKEWTAALGEQPAGVPVWEFPLRAFEIAADMARSGADPDAPPMPAEVCLELLAYTPIRLRSRDGAEVTTCLAQWASDTGQTVLEVVRDFQDGHHGGEFSWEEIDSDGVHHTPIYSRRPS